MFDDTGEYHYFGKVLLFHASWLLLPLPIAPTERNAAWAHEPDLMTIPSL
jgi:hypothetical protein